MLPLEIKVMVPVPVLRLRSRTIHSVLLMRTSIIPYPPSLSLFAPIRIGAVSGRPISNGVVQGSGRIVSPLCLIRLFYCQAKGKTLGQWGFFVFFL